MYYLRNIEIKIKTKINMRTHRNSNKSFSIEMFFFEDNFPVKLQQKKKKDSSCSLQESSRQNVSLETEI